MKELASAHINQLSADSVTQLENLAMENAEKLITEVQRRKALYDKSQSDYADRAIKDNLWNEVCEAMVEGWNELPPAEKAAKSKLKFKLVIIRI